MIEQASDLVISIAPVTDPLALILVCLIAFKKPSLVASIVAVEFFLTYTGYKWASAQPFWDNMAEDYCFMLAAKDLLLAYILIKACAPTSLVMAYGVASVLIWSVWFATQMLESSSINYELYLAIYYGSDVVYFVIMWAEVIILWRGGHGGKRIRPPVPVRRSRAYVSEPTIDDRIYTPPSQRMG